MTNKLDYEPIVMAIRENPMSIHVWDYINFIKDGNAELAEKLTKECIEAGNNPLKERPHVMKFGLNMMKIFSNPLSSNVDDQVNYIKQYDDEQVIKFNEYVKSARIERLKYLKSLKESVKPLNPIELGKPIPLNT